jgi:hypothetical protein
VLAVTATDRPASLKVLIMAFKQVDLPESSNKLKVREEQNEFKRQ